MCDTKSLSPPSWFNAILHRADSPHPVRLGLPSVISPGNHLVVTLLLGFCHGAVKATLMGEVNASSLRKGPPGLRRSPARPPVRILSRGLPPLAPVAKVPRQGLIHPEFGPSKTLSKAAATAEAAIPARDRFSPD